MLSASRTRLPSLLSGRVLRLTQSRANTSGTTTDNPVPVNNPNPKPPTPTTFGTTLPTSSSGAHDGAMQEAQEDAEARRVTQAPNRANVWSRSQKPRELAMVGPRFEQAIMEEQPRPYAAIELIHQQPVRWTHSRQVSCDGGGGPLGHPRISINTDKPQICFCTYCGVPYANEHHREMLEAQPTTTYPLEPTGNAAEVPESQRITDEAYGQR